MSWHGDLPCGDLPRRGQLSGDSDLRVQQHLCCDRNLSGHTLLRWNDDLSGYINLCWPGIVSRNEHLCGNRELRRRGHGHLCPESDVQSRRPNLL